ncbi:MAG: hypothetical protein LBJ61_11575 [Deltaproteobacteria bacterium]|jgi:uncharacterized protein (DUF1810 family)|nr:hypothetical protein [Deltaproteobacteria bacterium]
MATDLTMNVDVPKTKAKCSCDFAQQCLWYETLAPSSAACANRNSLVCQKYCEEVFGNEDSRKVFGSH